MHDYASHSDCWLSYEQNCAGQRPRAVGRLVKVINLSIMHWNQLEVSDFSSLFLHIFFFPVVVTHCELCFVYSPTHVVCVALTLLPVPLCVDT